MWIHNVDPTEQKEDAALRVMAAAAQCCMIKRGGWSCASGPTNTCPWRCQERTCFYIKNRPHFPTEAHCSKGIFS